MRHILGISRTLALIAAMHTFGCGQVGTETDNPAGPVQALRSSKAYLTEVSPSAADSASLRSGARAFALDLYRQVATRAAADENLFLGTHSVTTVLAMSSAGARGVTEAELALVLRHGLTQATLPAAMNQLTIDLRAGMAGSTVEYDALQSIWLDKDANVAPSFLDVLSEEYDTGVFLTDFGGNTEAARTGINQWVSQKTHGLIPELFDAGMINPLAEMVLTNAAYLSAPWQDRFDPASTKTQEFSLDDGSAVDVPMMSREWQYPFAFDIDWRAFELPFTANQMSVVFVLPNAGEFAALEGSFDSATVERIVGALDASRKAPKSVVVSVPRFQFASSIALKEPLEALGLVTAFDQARADFSGIDSNRHLYVDQLVHRTTVAVDENGTTAAVSTGQVLVPMGIAPNIKLDRPFLFFLYDRTTGSVLFVGRLLRPTGQPHTPTQTVAEKTDAQVICSSLGKCQGRTTSETDCETALAPDDAAVVRRCADCIRLGTDECGAMSAASCGWSHGDICAPATCAAYCPGHAF